MPRKVGAVRVRVRSFHDIWLDIGRSDPVNWRVTPSATAVMHPRLL